MSVKPDPVAARKLLSAMRLAKLGTRSRLPRLIYLTDPERSVDPCVTASALPPGSAVIYRHFGMPDRFDEARNLRSRTRRRNIRLLIANDPLLAMAVGADGVHWPEANVSQAKYWRRRFPLMTASAHSRAALQLASLSFVDAALFSTVFTSTSPSASTPIGALRFRVVARGAPLPIYALGGVTGHNAQQISAAGGIASISGIEAAFGA